MLSLIALLTLADSQAPKVSIREAVATAQWFCRCVDVKAPAFSSIKLEPRRNDYGTAIYQLSLITPDNKASMTLQIDANSGDVLHAEYFPQTRNMRFATSAQTDLWLKRLGRLKGLQKEGDRYTAILNGHRFLNLNGGTLASIGTADGKFAWYNAPGALPPPPVGKPTVAKSRAEAVAKAEFVKTRGSWPYPLVAQTSLGLFYDDRARQTRWAWAVIEGFISNGKFSDICPYYIDGQNGRLIPDQFYQSSMLRYQSRPDRQGLASVKPLKVEIPALDLIERKLKQIGRSDVRFDSVEVKQGIRVGSRMDQQMELGPKGELYSFNVPMGRATLTQAQSMARAKQLILAERPKLPEGVFMIEPYGGHGNPYFKVIYRQKALGYEYLDNAHVTVWLGGKGGLAKYYVVPVLPRPRSVPTKLLSRADIEKIALRLAAPRVPKDTKGIHNYATAKAGPLGWAIDPSTGQPRLCYRVDVWFMRDVKNWAIQGGGTYYPVDAVTGKFLRRFP